MSARVSWYVKDKILLCVLAEPVSMDELDDVAQEVWALAAGAADMLDIIFDYTGVKSLPPKAMVPLNEGPFKIPVLDRVALVGEDHLIAMAFATLTHDTFRPSPTAHPNVKEAADYLSKTAQEY
jgi:hypothetical protein